MFGTVLVALAVATSAPNVTICDPTNPKPAVLDDQYRQLLCQRRDSALVTFVAVMCNYLAERRGSTYERVHAASCRYLDAALAADERPESQVTAYLRHARAVHWLAVCERKWFEQGRMGISDLEVTPLALLREAQLQWIEAYRRRFPDRPLPAQQLNQFNEPLNPASCALVEFLLGMGKTVGVLPTEGRVAGQPLQDVKAITGKLAESIAADISGSPDSTSGADLNDPIIRLKTARLTAVRKELSGRVNLFVAGSARSSNESLFNCIARFRESDLALKDKPAEQLAIHERMARITEQFEQAAKVRFDGGEMSAIDYEQFRYYRLDAQIKLIEFQKRAAAAPKK